VAKDLVLNEEDDDNLSVEDILKNLPGWNENKWFLEYVDVENEDLK
jgi:hypothetical protein